MRAHVATGLALLAAVHGGAVCADPAAPQLAPQHGRREDTRLLDEQLRGLDDRPPAEPVPLAAAPPATTEPPTRGPGFTVGVVLLAVAGVSAATALGLYAFGPSDPADASAFDSAKGALVVTSALSGAAGLGLVIANRSLRVAPTVAPRAVGLAIAGAL